MSRPDRFTLVGSGLVGSLLALFLARRGAEVRVLERRADLRKERIRAGRSINLAISVRGLHALGQVGLAERALQHAIAMRGRAIHPLDGALAFQPYGKDDSQCIHSISRGWLNGMLMSEAEATGRVRLDFHHRVTALDVGQGGLRVVNERDGHQQQLPAAAVVGTDGAASVVRDAVVASEGGTSTEERLEHGYKELTLPAGPGGSFLLEKHALHIWPRRDFMLIALPNLDGSFTCTLFLRFVGNPSFETLKRPEEVRAFFGAHFPDALALLPDLEAQFFDNPTGSMVTVKCWPWAAESRAVLLGDAAHAIVPFFGQGMNCGFEDCEVLDGVLAQRADLGAAFAEFARLRKPNADAIADMAVENFVEMRDSVADARFLLEKSIERRLLNAFPGEFLSRYALVSFSRAPYRLAYEVGRVAAALVSELATGVASAEEVDLTAARRLVQGRLSPLVSQLPQSALG
ncbi:MAG: FAD-dependent oxidoreductase [Myxococcaceae bacterium]